MDQGVIRAFKAHYRRLFCLRAIERDDADESNIFGINMLEALQMARTAWSKVTPETIRNCWKKSGIAYGSSEVNLSEANTTITITTNDQLIRAWATMRLFLTSPMTLPDAEKALKEIFGNAYDDSKWRPTLTEINDLEPDSEMEPILEKIDTHLKKIPLAPVPQINQTVSTDLTEVETDLMKQVQLLKHRNRIHGRLPTLEELINPIEENDIGEGEFRFGKDADKKIVERVQYEERVKKGEIIEVDDGDDDDEPAPDVSLKVLIETVKALEFQCQTGSIDDPDIAEAAMGLRGHLVKFRGSITKLCNSKAKQARIDDFLQL
ncbi:hypothetical protein VKT23_018437 [Stygiomarasmius scandens]|uniref:DDE-1 domain-containing protein n=1 Tax=Marasmiellus scandens TaxID=2682957 RepID=A0ABR1IP83_9AGAR